MYLEGGNVQLAVSVKDRQRGGDAGSWSGTSSAKGASQPSRTGWPRRRHDRDHSSPSKSLRCCAQLHAQPALADRFLTHMLTRNIRIEEDLVDHLFNSSEKRLARTLLLLARYGEPDEPTACLPRVSQETLAEMVGTTRSRVNFFMNKFRELGFIAYNGGVEDEQLAPERRPARLTARTSPDALRRRRRAVLANDCSLIQPSLFAVARGEDECHAGQNHEKADCQEHGGSESNPSPILTGGPASPRALQHSAIPRELVRWGHDSRLLESYVRRSLDPTVCAVGLASHPGSLLNWTLLAALAIVPPLRCRAGCLARRGPCPKSSRRDADDHTGCCSRDHRFREPLAGVAGARRCQ